MKTTDKSIKKTNSYLRMGIIMLTFAAVGAVIGFVLINILYGNINGIKTGFSGAVSQIQQFMVPLLLAIMAVSVIYGEVNLHKLKLIGKMILQTEDEECDKWDYEEEKTGAWGTAVNVLSQIACILVLASGYSLKYIEDEHHVNMLAACVIFLACYSYDGLWSVRFVKTIQNIHPEKKGDPSSKNFREQWLQSCDEAEKEIIYQSAYKSYSRTNQWLPALLGITMLGHLFFDTGIMAVITAAAIWLIVTVSYLHSCVVLKRAKLRE